MPEHETKKKPLYFIAALGLLGLALWAVFYFWYQEYFHVVYIDAAILFSIPISLAWLRWSNVFKCSHK